MARSETKNRGAVCGNARTYGSVGAVGEQSPMATRCLLSELECWRRGWKMQLIRPIRFALNRNTVDTGAFRYGLKGRSVSAQGKAFTPPPWVVG